MKVFCENINEFFWLWLASISPVLLAFFLFLIEGVNYSFSKIVKDVFLAGPIFAYVAALLAPFLFVLAKLLSKKEGEKLKFGGLALVTTVIVTLISTFLFYNKQMSLLELEEDLICLV